MALTKESGNRILKNTFCAKNAWAGPRAPGWLMVFWLFLWHIYVRTGSDPGPSQNTWLSAQRWVNPKGLKYSIRETWFGCLSRIRFHRGPPGITPQTSLRPAGGAEGPHPSWEASKNWGPDINNSYWWNGLKRSLDINTKMFSHSCQSLRNWKFLETQNVKGSNWVHPAHTTQDFIWTLGSPLFRGCPLSRCPPTWPRWWLHTMVKNAQGAHCWNSARRSTRSQFIIQKPCGFDRTPEFCFMQLESKTMWPSCSVI